MELNSYFYCQLTLQLFVDPVMDAEGNTYERAAIEEWIKKKGTSPITRNPLSVSDLRYNRALKCAISEELDKAKAGASSSAPEVPDRDPDWIDLSAGIADIELKTPETSVGLINVQSFEGFSLSKVAVFLFTGRQNSLVLLRNNSGGGRAGSYPNDDIMWSDGTIMNAAHRILYRYLGIRVTLSNIRRFVWNGNTAVYTASTIDHICLKKSPGCPTPILCPASQIINALSLPGSLEIRNTIFEETSRLLVASVIDKLQEFTTAAPLWECLINGGKWVPYETRLQKKMVCAAEEFSSKIVYATIKSVPYELNLATLEQHRIDGISNTVRKMRKSLTHNYCT